MWLCIHSGKQFEDTFENAQQRKIKQMQLMLLCLFSGWKFENISKMHGGRSQTKVTYEKYTKGFDMTQSEVSSWHPTFLPKGPWDFDLLVCLHVSLQFLPRQMYLPSFRDLGLSENFNGYAHTITAQNHQEEKRNIIIRIIMIIIMIIMLTEFLGRERSW